MNSLRKSLYIFVLIGLTILLFPRSSYSINSKEIEETAYQGVNAFHPAEIVSTEARGNGSITIDSNNLVAVAFQTDGDNGDDLTYARRTSDGVWTSERVATVTHDTPSVSADLDSNDNPHISYAICFFFDCTGAYTYWTGSSWDVTEDMYGYGSLDVDTNDTIHIGYYDEATENLSYMHLSGNTWITATVDTDPIVNSNLSLKVDNDNYPRISYYKGDLIYQARWTGTNWTDTLLASAPDAASLEGQQTSIAIGEDNRSHIAYYYSDGETRQLRYTRQVSTAWAYKIIDREGDVGQYAAIALDSDDSPHFAYYDATNRAIKYAHQTDTGWRTITIEEDIGNGDPMAIAIDSNDRVHITYFVRKGPLEQYLKYTYGDLTTLFNDVYLPAIIK